MNFLEELKGRHRLESKWLIELEKQAALPNDGWPETSTKKRYPKFREIFTQFSDVPPEVHEFDLLKFLFEGWSPALSARKKAIEIRESLDGLQVCIDMLENNARIR